jgi:flagellar biosynthetic protein FlhB
MSGERSEEATPKKLRDARRRGEVWQSRELATAGVLLATGGVLGATAGEILDALVAIHQLSIDVISGAITAPPGAVLEASIAIAARAVAPVIAAMVVVGALASVVQVGPLFAPAAVAWRPERLDPIAGARRVVSPRRLFELLRSIAILVVLAAVVIITLRDGLRGALGLAGRDALATLRAGGSLVHALLLRAGGAMLAIAVVDVLYQRWRFLRDQRMSKREVERERVETEGDPHVEHARQRLRRDIASRSVIESARDADVVVTDAARLAIALVFDEASGQAAPELRAKGRDELAQRMIAAARERGTPIADHRALARALDRLDVGAEIPEGLYEPVAALLSAPAVSSHRASLLPAPGARTPPR